MKSAIELDEMVTQLSAIRERLDLQSLVVKQIREEETQLELSLIAELEEAGLKSFKGNRGLISVVKKNEVKFPANDWDRKAALKSYMEQRGDFESSWSVNHMTLNRWYKEVAEEATKKGELPDVPGLDPKESQPILSFRKV